jgi:hypothetical protein
MIRGAAQIVDKVKSDTQWNKAVAIMKRYDPDFCLEELTFEAEEIFREFYCNYLAGNKEYLDKVSSGPVALLGAMIELRNKEGWKFKYEELLDCGVAHFAGATLIEGQPAFTFTIEIQEFDAKVRVSDGSDYFYQPPVTEEEPTDDSIK